jgi:hypothetical protein
MWVDGCIQRKKMLNRNGLLHISVAVFLGSSVNATSVTRLLYVSLCPLGSDWHPICRCNKRRSLFTKLTCSLWNWNHINRLNINDTIPITAEDVVLGYPIPQCCFWWRRRCCKTRGAKENQLDVGLSSDMTNRKTRGAKQSSLMLVYSGTITRLRSRDAVVFVDVLCPMSKLLIKWNC